MARQFLRKEFELHGFPVAPWRYRFLLRGYHSDKRYLYDHGNNGLPLPVYLTDFERLRTRHLNTVYRGALDNKILFSQVFSELFRCPRNFGLLEKDGRFTPVDPEMQPLLGGALEDVLAALPDRVVMKRIAGGGGKDIYLVERVQNGFRVNGELSGLEFLTESIGDRRFLIMEWIEQGAYGKQLFPGSVNTVRVVTANDAEGPYVVFAVQRIGRTESAPTDNFNQGGLCSQVDLDTGEVGHALYYSGHDRPAAFDIHPDTGVCISGQAVPQWNEIKRSLLRAVALFPGFAYVGWDVIIFDEGFMVLEGNSYPGVQVLQLHEPFLTRHRVAQFFAEHGVLSRRRATQLGVEPPNEEKVLNAMGPEKADEEDRGK